MLHSLETRRGAQANIRIVEIARKTTVDDDNRSPLARERQARRRYETTATGADVLLRQRDRDETVQTTPSVGSTAAHSA